MELTVAGFALLARSRIRDAARAWLAADSILQEPAAFDPWHAASRSNAGAARVILGEPQEAEIAFADAESAWRRVIAGIDMLDVPMTGASSAFHFRLAAAEPAAFVSARRRRYHRLAGAALEITRFNRASFARDVPVPVDLPARCHVLKLVLSEAVGASSAEVRLLEDLITPNAQASMVASFFTRKSEAIAQSQPTFAAALSDACAELETAAELTVLLPPSAVLPPNTETEIFPAISQTEFE